MKKIKSILISQPEPESGKSPYFDLAKKHKTKVDFTPFIQIEGVPGKEFRKSKVTFTDFSSVIFTSRNSVDHFFRICEELRIRMSQETKYFCVSEAIALYLQKYILYRKRKVTFGNGRLDELKELLQKHKENERFLLPCSSVHKEGLSKYLEENGFSFSKGVIYKTVSSDLSSLEKLNYDVIIFFSPSGVKSLFENFPDFKQEGKKIGAFGSATAKAIRDAGLDLDIEAPMPNSPSMASALDVFLTSIKR